MNFRKTHSIDPVPLVALGRVLFLLVCFVGATCRADKARPRGEVVIIVKNDGSITFNGRMLPLEELKALTPIKGNTVVVRSEPKADYNKVMDVMDAIASKTPAHLP